MTNKLLMTVSAIALMVAMPALAAQVTRADANAQAELSDEQARSVPDHSVTESEVKKGWENTKETVKENAQEAKEATKDAYEKIKAKLMNEKNSNGEYATYTVESRMTADGMLGKPVYNHKNKKIATVKDIILDQSGKAQLIVLNDGDFFGMGGKMAAFDYGLVTSHNEEGDVIMPISEETLKKVAEFSYDAKDAGDGKVRVIPTNGYSVSKILDGNILNAQSKKIADIENITFRNGEASRLIVGFDKTLGMGGDQAALDYDDLKAIKHESSVDFQMSSSQAANFASYKKSAIN